MALGHCTNSSPIMGLFIVVCVLMFSVEQRQTNPVDGVEKTESCIACTICDPCEIAEHCGSYRRKQKHGNAMQVEPSPHQDLVMTCIYQCLSWRKTVLLILSTLYVLKLKVTKEVSSKQEDLPPIESKEPTSEDETDANDFLREVASLYQEAVREVDFATVGRRVGLKDYQIEEIINNQAEELRGEAMLKYHDWYSTKSPQGIDDLRDDIVAERIKLLPDILVQYKRPQRCVAYAG